MVGFYDSGFFTPYHAFIWTEETDIQVLGTLDPANDASLFSYATDVSRNGSVVVGYSQVKGGATSHAFRWTKAGGMEDLGSAAGPNGYSAAFGVSADGSIVVGESEFPDGTRRAFVWTRQDGFKDLGTIDGTLRSLATAISGDGRVIVGTVFVNLPSGNTTVGRRRAFRWTETDGMQNLGALDTLDHSAATAVSDDGATVVGFSSPFAPAAGLGTPFDEPTPSDRAFIWTPSKGSRDVGESLSDAGVEMTGISVLTATDLSADGEWITCLSVTPETPAGEFEPSLASHTFTAAGVSDFPGLGISIKEGTARISLFSLSGFQYALQRRDADGEFQTVDQLVGRGDIDYFHSELPTSEADLFQITATPLP